MTEVFPDKRWFKNTPENIAACLKRFPKTIGFANGGKPISQEWFDARPKAGRFKHADGELYASLADYPEDEYIFELKPKQFPIGHYFLNTPENLDAFKKDFPEQKWIHDDDYLAISVMNQVHYKQDGTLAFVANDINGKIAFTSGPEPSDKSKRYYFPHETPSTSRLLNVGEYITVSKGRLEDACREFSNVDEYVKTNSSCKKENDQHTISFAFCKDAMYDVEPHVRWCQSATCFSIFGCKELYWAGSALNDKLEVVTEAVKTVQTQTVPKGKYITIPKGRTEEVRKVFSDLDMYCKHYGNYILPRNVGQDVYFMGNESWDGNLDYVKKHHTEHMYLLDGDKGPVEVAAKAPPAYGQSPIACAVNELTYVRDLTHSPIYQSMFSPSISFLPRFEKESTMAMTQAEIQQVAIEVVKLNAPTSRFSAPGIAGKALSFLWGSTKKTTGWVFQPVKKISQLVACIAALSAIGYGGYQGYSWCQENVSLPSVTWEAPADASPGDVK